MVALPVYTVCRLASRLRHTLLMRPYPGGLSSGKP